jgi:NADH:ubiquinone oxidoreductase subunit B-like Fe-S oxidoreductase
VILLCAPTRLPRPVALALTALQLKIRTSWMSTLQQEKKKKQKQQEEQEEEQQQQRRQ